MFVQILLDILSILAIIIFGSLVVVIIADLILCMFDDHEGIIFRRKKKDTSVSSTNIEVIKEENSNVKKDDIVVYSDKTNPNGVLQSDTNAVKIETLDGEKVQEIDYDKAIEEQKQLSKINQKAVQPAIQAQPERKEKKVEKAPENDMFWDNDEEEDNFNKVLDKVIKEAKKAGTPKEKEEKETVAPVIKEDKTSEETKKELEELKALKEQQQKELDEFKKLKEDFAREKEEQLALMKDNLDKAKADEIEKIRQEALKEQEKIEAEKAKLEEEQAKLAEEQAKVQQVEEKEPIIKETIIKDEEELNKLKYKNLMRMNSRLTRIIRDTEKLQAEKLKNQQKAVEEKRKLQEREEQERLREQERINEIQRKNQERLLQQQEALRKKNEINQKLNEVSKKAGKYKLDSKVVKITKEVPAQTEHIVEETVTTVETIPHTDTQITTVEKTPLVATPKPIFEKAYYEQKLIELDEEMKEAEKELRINKSEYIPLTRIHKAYNRDSEKLRKKEIQVAKQKVALYGVNSTKIDPTKKAKLDENLQALAELKDSVEHCEEVIKKNKDRYPVLEKNNRLIQKQIDRINEDIKVCEKAISYYNKKKEN